MTAPDMTAGSAASPPVAAMLRLVTGSWVAQAVHVAAKLGVADELAAGPLPALDLAARTGADPDALYRVLRALASLGIFAEESDRRFGLTPMAESLRGDVPGSVRDFAIMMGEQWVWRSWGDMMHSVRTGEPAFEHVFGAPVFDYYAAHADAAQVGAAGLTSRSGPENAAIVAGYDFSAARTVTDVGGGEGSLLRAVLRANPGLNGTLFDMAHVIERVAAGLTGTPEAAGCELVAGDFFSGAPLGADIYLLKKVIHDWADEPAAAILRSCRTAMHDGARLLLIEHVVAPANEPSFAKLLDLLMLVYPGGRERTIEEHSRLLAAAGLSVTRVLPTAADVSIIEAVPV